MTEGEKNWLLRVFPQFRDRTLRGEVVDAYYEAERILLKKEQITTRGCSCEYRSLATNVNKLYDLWLEKNT